MPKFTIIESPYRGDLIVNIQYARRALRDSIQRGEVPFASHLLYTQALCDDVPAERALGMSLGSDLLRVIAAGIKAGTGTARCAVYDDLGVSDGMKLGIEAAAKLGLPVEFRKVPGWPNAVESWPKNVVPLKEVTNG